MTVPPGQPAEDRLARAVLQPAMPPEQFDEVVAVTRRLLERRFLKVREMVDVASRDVNINPFLMLALAPAYNIFSPFEAAENAQMTKLLHGDSTAFGKFVERDIFTIFGGREPPEKAVKATRAMFSSIDQELTVEGTRYLATYKSGPWTMNQSHANEMLVNFPQIRQITGCEIVIGIFYGRRSA